ncbi:hypothetical protein K458DRAFT_415913 [Lentithecium fluviatile CBS 122367]|uniref:Mitochondrial carrier protein pet8 n=1 Tax=Lentithecium fluviatile CBS 122367 TaxID=1168545 RepID=A0A6G1J8S7_9PLEO|nr:hypothetical protein K458DRAFT_415913 [Lentithecium fluviatile CBS 122367]
MSAFRTLAVRRTPLVSYGLMQRASFHASIVRGAGKETKLHTEGRANEVEEMKQDQLRKQKEGKGHWEESLASDSESIIKADRGEDGKTTAETIQKLQEETKKVEGKL